MRWAQSRVLAIGDLICMLSLHNVSYIPSTSSWPASSDSLGNDVSSGIKEGLSSPIDKEGAVMYTCMRQGH